MLTIIISKSTSRGGGGGASNAAAEMTAKSLLEECFPDTLKKHALDTPKKARKIFVRETTTAVDVPLAIHSRYHKGIFGRRLGRRQNE